MSRKSYDQNASNYSSIAHLGGYKNDEFNGTKSTMIESEISTPMKNVK